VETYPYVSWRKKVKHNLIPEELGPAASAYLVVVDRIEVREDFPHIAATSIQNGKVVLTLGGLGEGDSRLLFKDLSPDQKRNTLEHEAHHVGLGHFARQGDRKAMLSNGASLWNVVCDASIDHLGVPAMSIQVGDVGFGGATFERLEIPPMPPEVAYDFLLKKLPQIEIPGCGCGGHTGEGEMDPAMIPVASAISAAIGAHHLSKFGSGMGRDIPPIPPLPPWLEEVREHLRSYRWSSIRKRSWTRQNRRIPILPGRIRTREKEADIFVDVSGSITQEDLGLAIAVIRGICRIVRVRLWDTTTSDELEGLEALQALKTFGGGGTDPHQAAVHRVPGRVTVWLSDGYVGGWPEMTEDDVVVRWTSDGEVPHGAGADIIATREGHS